MDRVPTDDRRRAQGSAADRALAHATREHAEQFWLGHMPVVHPYAP